jgi:diadenosine tetraphosphate (Ap4A) HIT family hydrolase
VIWNAHQAEMSDLSSEERQRLLDAVLIVEQAQRAHLTPYKINLASLGNSVPHLHWHVIPRYFDDAHFPHPIWGMRQRESDPVVVAARRQRVAGLERAIVAAFGSA